MLYSAGLRKLILIIAFSSSIFANEKETNRPKWFGETNFSDGQSKSFITTIGAEYKVQLYETENFVFSLYGKIHTDLDHFGNEIKTNVFTTINIDF